jgi:hypothetical protein
MSQNRPELKNARPGFVRGVAVGFLVGVLLASGGIALAAMGKAAWSRLDPLVRGGYVAGFTDCLRMAKANDPEGWLATNYILPPVKPIQWVAKVDELYEQKDLQNAPLHQVLLLAGHKLAEETGYREVKAGDPRLERLRAVLQGHRGKTAEAAAPTAESEKPTGAGGETGAATGVEGEKTTAKATESKAVGESAESAPDEAP